MLIWCSAAFYFLVLLFFLTVCYFYKMKIRKIQLSRLLGKTPAAITQATKSREGRSPALPIVDGKFIDTRNPTVLLYMAEAGVVLTDDQIKLKLGIVDKVKPVPKPKRVKKVKPVKVKAGPHIPPLPQQQRSPQASGPRTDLPPQSQQQRSPHVPTAPPEPDLNSFEARMAKAKLRKIEADATKAENQALQLRGKLVDRALFVDVCMKYLAELSARLLNEMPIGVSTVVAGLEQDENFTNKIEQEIHDNVSMILRDSKSKIVQTLESHPETEMMVDAAE